jgi:hypothetical protein
MKETITLFGAGGKMGVRLSKNLLKSDYVVRHVEPSPVGRKRLKDELGVECVSAEEALVNTDVVILAVPDTLIGKLAHEISPKLRPGTMVMLLDAAAPFAGHLPDRKDLTYFVAHPCHPTIFNDETEEAARRGVPAQCARDFLLGHMNILGAVIFNEIPGAFSDACNKAITFGKPRLMRDDWIKVFDRAEIAESIRRIT